LGHASCRRRSKSEMSPRESTTLQESTEPDRGVVGTGARVLASNSKVSNTGGSAYRGLCKPLRVAREAPWRSRAGATAPSRPFVRAINDPPIGLCQGRPASLGDHWPWDNMDTPQARWPGYVHRGPRKRAHARRFARADAVHGFASAWNVAASRCGGSSRVSSPAQGWPVTDRSRLALRLSTS
jgi:hypothetical protein